MRKILLKHKEGVDVDRAKFLAKYESPSKSNHYKMLNGVPVLVNIEGHYVMVKDILDLLVRKEDYSTAHSWVISILGGTELPPEVKWSWARDGNGNLR